LLEYPTATYSIAASSKITYWERDSVEVGRCSFTVYDISSNQFLAAMRDGASTNVYNNKFESRCALLAKRRKICTLVFRDMLNPKKETIYKRCIKRY